MSSILDKIKTMKKAGPLFLDLHLIKPSQCSSIGVVYSVETVLDATTGLPPPASNPDVAIISSPVILPP